MGLVPGSGRVGGVRLCVSGESGSMYNPKMFVSCNTCIF